MTNRYWRFELRCRFDETVFIWPPEDAPPLRGETSDDALMRDIIVCPGDTERMIASHIEIMDSRGTQLEVRDCFDIISHREEAPQ